MNVVNGRPSSLTLALLCHNLDLTGPHLGLAVEPVTVGEYALVAQVPDSLKGVVLRRVLDLYCRPFSSFLKLFYTIQYPHMKREVATDYFVRRLAVCK